MAKKKATATPRRRQTKDPNAYESRRVPNLRYLRQVEAREQEAEVEAPQVSNTTDKEG